MVQIYRLVILIFTLLILSCRTTDDGRQNAIGPQNQDQYNTSDNQTYLAKKGGDEDKKNKKVRICHFPENDKPRIIEISENALEAHLKHGDAYAPLSVSSNEDCLIPQPTEEPVAANAITDKNGHAIIYIPQTNVRLDIKIKDENSKSLTGIGIEVIVSGSDYFAVAWDPNALYAPDIREGTILNAKPGSGLVEKIHDFVLTQITTVLPGVSFINKPLTIPSFVNTYFNTSEKCFTKDEYEDHVWGHCTLAFLFLSAANASLTSGSVGMALFNTFFANNLKNGVFQILTSASPHCDLLAKLAAEESFQGEVLPKKFKSYEPPFLPGLRYLPFYTQEVGNCGGGCCIAGGQQCELKSSEPKCLQDSGFYNPNTPCSQNPCGPKVIFEDTFSPQQPGWSFQSPSSGFLGELNNNVNVGSVTLSLPASTSGDGVLEFELLAIRSLDGLSCCSDVLTFTGNGSTLFSGVFHGDGIISRSEFRSNPSGATYTGNGIGNRTSVYRFSVPISIITGNNTFTWSYSPLQPLFDEAWGLDNVVIKKN